MLIRPGASPRLDELGVGEERFARQDRLLGAARREGSGAMFRLRARLALLVDEVAQRDDEALDVVLAVAVVISGMIRRWSARSTSMWRSSRSQSSAWTGQPDRRAVSIIACVGRRR